MTGQIVPLDLLAVEECGRVASVDGEAQSVHRLAEMGLCIGAAVRMVQPGSPCILAVNGHRLSFRPETSICVLVELA